MARSTELEPEIAGISTQLVSRLRHQFNHHLGSIFLNTDLISVSSPETRAIAEEITRSANDLWAAASGISLLLGPGPDPVLPLSKVVDVAVRLLNAELAARGWTVESDVEPGLEAKTSQLAEVFQAILLAGEAACESAGSEGASLTISVRVGRDEHRIRLRATPPGTPEGPSCTRLERFLAQRGWSMHREHGVFELHFPTGDGK